MNEIAFPDKSISVGTLRIFIVFYSYLWACVLFTYAYIDIFTHIFIYLLYCIVLYYIVLYDIIWYDIILFILYYIIYYYIALFYIF